MNVSEKAFTLVELIVVITILAILWTVAFVSLQEYTTYARNAVRLDGISKVATAVQVKTQAWVWVMSFVKPGQEVPSAQIWWTTVIPGTNYQAWEINTRALEIKSEDFSDPTNDKLFSMWATTKKWGQYEIASTIEESWSDRAILNGNYASRDSDILVWTGILLENTFTLSDTRDINKLFKWDTISWTGVPTDTTVKSISNDGLTITLSNILAADSNAIQLASSETSGMIVSVDGVTPVTAGTPNVPYNVSSNSSSTIAASSAVTCEWNAIWSTFEEDWVTYKVVENGTGANGIRNAANIAFIDNANNTNLCTSNVTDMSEVFFNNNTFNEDIWDWDTSSIQNMRSAFLGASSFNQDIWDWDTSSVTHMGSMFQSASSFNQDIWDWDTGSVEAMFQIFDNASSFNQDIWDWDTSAVTSFTRIFSWASSFNQDIWDWDTSAVRNMFRTFRDASSFNQDISDWDTNLVTNMHTMFGGAQSFDQDISDWDVDNVESFSNFDNNTSTDWETAEKPSF